MSRLAGKTAIITGGARGMGAATSRLFAKEGARVAITDVLEDAGASLASELGETTRFYQHDVTSAAGWAALVERAEADLGPIDILVNNAGILLFKSLLQTSLEEYERVLRVNLIGTFLGIKAVAPGMIARGKGAIVNISSVDGMKGANGLGAYASSKWGVRGLTRVAAMELGHQGVRVNSVHPGGINTVMTNHDNSPRDKVDERFRNVSAALKKSLPPPCFWPATSPPIWWARSWRSMAACWSAIITKACLVLPASNKRKAATCRRGSL
jgi:3alpha(or 20beta)-hydroxysteroid dehydrogenase